MQNFNEIKLELLKSIGKFTSTINNEVDWFLALSNEKDPKKQRFARNMFIEKQKETRQLAKEEYERFCK